ncbi:MAG: hydrogen peroxide-inducible genes activator [Planctomycetes bacterium]|nr:hydrogen peroxide-inducible genes activator [Planctomycetota bacterium]
MSTNFTLRQLEYAVAAARHLNFGEAARACYVSQPSLSAQLGQLETLLGQKLFERTPRGVALTPFGQCFVPEAAEILARAGRLEDLARAGHEPLSGELKLGVIPTVAPFVLPASMPILRERHPAARVYLVEGQTELLLQRLADGQLDVLLLALEAELGSVASLAVFRDPFVVALPKGHALARKKKLGLDDIPRDELLLLEEGHCLSRQVEEVCALGRDRDADDFRASSLVTLLQMVAMGMGITLLPKVAEKSSLVGGSGLVLRPLAEEAYRTIGLAWRPDCPRRPEFELLAEVMEEAAPVD